MYAIIAEDGRQIRVEEGQEINLDLREDASKGDELQFERVLAVSKDDAFQIGKPTVDGATVTAEVIGVAPGKKIYVQKFRRRKTYRRRTGHRQLYTRVRISKINA